MKAHEIGVCRVWLSCDEAPYHIHPDDYAKVRNAFISGHDFVEARDIYGAEITLRVESISSVSLVTPEQIKEAADDYKAENLRSSFE